MTKKKSKSQQTEQISPCDAYGYFTSTESMRCNECGDIVDNDEDEMYWHLIEDHGFDEKEEEFDD